MKKNNSKNKPRASNAKKNSSKKYLTKQNRPIHRKIALHPLSIFFMLCVGVLLVVSTINAAADSITVTAVVPPPPGPSAPAEITDPTDGEQFATQVIDVDGTCPVGSSTSDYVALLTNNVETGYDNCSSGNTFQITTTLSPGANSLQAEIFDFFNTPGPVLPAINVDYDVPSSPQTNISPPVVAPQAIQVLQVDNNIPFVSASIIQSVTTTPTITGTAPPFSHISITIHSEAIYCETNADAQGYWSCKVSQILPLGLHHVYVQATTLLGKVLNFQTFEFIATQQPKTKAVPSNITVTTSFKDTQYLIGRPINFNINVAGGVAPYAFDINWGDGTNTTVTRLTSGPFEISHTYTKTGSLIDYKTIKIEGIDSQGDADSLQLFAPIKNPAYTNIVSYITQSSGLWSVFSSVGSWLWIIWPGYIIIMLMVFSFWLGEKQELIYLIKGSRHKKRLTAKR